MKHNLYNILSLKINDNNIYISIRIICYYFLIYVPTTIELLVPIC